MSVACARASTRSGESARTTSGTLLDGFGIGVPLFLLERRSLSSSTADLVIRYAPARLVQDCSTRAASDFDSASKCIPRFRSVPDFLESVEILRRWVLSW